MSWHMNCLLCEPGTKWCPPYPREGSLDLVAIQEHAMREHGVTQEALRDQTSVVISPGNYEYTLPDGRRWLWAWKDPQETPEPAPVLTTEEAIARARLMESK